MSELLCEANSLQFLQLQSLWLLFFVQPRRQHFCSFFLRYSLKDASFDVSRSEARRAGDDAWGGKQAKENDKKNQKRLETVFIRV